MHQNKKRIIYTIIALLVILALALILIYSNIAGNIRSLFEEEKVILTKGKITECTDLSGVKDYYTQDTLQIKYESGAPDLFGDYCKDAKNLIEYSCAGNSMNSEEYKCESGCFEGACIIPGDSESIFNQNISQKCTDYKIISPINAIAQSTYGAYSALNAIDNDVLTNWYGDPNSRFPKWIYFDLGDKKCIHQIDLYAFKGDLPIVVDIQASQDAVLWTSISKNISLKDSSAPNITMPSYLVAKYI